MSHPQYSHIGEPEDRLVEEMGELLQALGKARRFGWFNYHPDHPHISNIYQVQHEMEDVVEAMEKLEVKLRDMRANLHASIKKNQHIE